MRPNRGWDILTGVEEGIADYFRGVCSWQNLRNHGTWAGKRGAWVWEGSPRKMLLVTLFKGPFNPTNFIYKIDVIELPDYEFAIGIFKIPTTSKL